MDFDCYPMRKIIDQEIKAVSSLTTLSHTFYDPRSFHDEVVKILIGWSLCATVIAVAIYLSHHVRVTVSSDSRGMCS